MPTARPFDPEPPGQHVAVMVTRRCNMSCGHCSVESAPGIRGEPGETELLAWVRDVASAGVVSLRLTGGEPMLRPRVVLRLLRECRRLGVGSTMTSNGFWGRHPAQARRRVRALKRAGLGSLVLSYDRYHAEFQGPDPIRHISAAADAEGLPLRVTLVRGTDEDDLASLVTRLAPLPAAHVRIYDLQPVGRARSLPVTLHRAEVEGFCSACSAPAVGDDGRFMACNGPAYFEPDGSPLVVGSVRDTPVAVLLERFRQDPVLDTIRTSGPAGLRDTLKTIPGFEGFPFRPSYSGICDLCHHITRSRDAVAALRRRLSQPEAEAARHARWQVIDGHRRAGVLNPAYINGVGAGRLLLRAALDGRIGPEAEHLLGRADFEWRTSLDYVSGSGLARPLAPVLDDPAFVRWAPRFYVEALRARAVTDGMRALVQRDAIGRIAAALARLGGRGVLLKGSALLTLAGDVEVTRAATDVDILVDPRIAAPLAERLAAEGFDGEPGAGHSTAQHLAPLSCQGVPVEIHTRIMEPFWGLPERDMLARAPNVAGSDVLATLSPEGMLYHAGVHASAGFFSFGLKTAWDIVKIVERSEIDWDLIASWAERSRAPRTFWTPVLALSDALGLPLPASFLRHAPRDRGGRRAALVARHRLFHATETPLDLDVLTKAGMMLLLQDRAAGKLRYAAAKIAWRGGRPSTWRSAAMRAGRADLLRQAWRQLRRYRRAVRRAAALAADSGP